VAIFANALLEGHELTINGDGEQTRDFVHVSDVVRANLAVTDDLSSRGPFNVGTGVETSVNALYEALTAIVPARSAAKHGPAKAGEQMRSVLDGSRFAPYVYLEEGLRRTVEWFRRR
jgi:UDP-glucose 4-epimerase